jgi:hypothetical protein
MTQPQRTCEWADNDFDVSLRFSCGRSATFGVYDQSTLAIEHYTCTGHVGNVPRTWGTVILPGNDVQTIRRELGA